MTIINTLTVRQLQSSLETTYNEIALTLNGDTSGAGTTVRQAINYFINLPLAQLSDLTNLRDAIYTYQKQLGNKISLNAAIAKLLLNVKSFIADNQIGYTTLDQGLAKEFSGPSYAQILSNIQAAVAAIPTVFTNNDIATAIATALGSGSNTDLIAQLELDFDTAVIQNGGYTPQFIQNAIASITDTDSSSIVSSIYNIFSNINFWSSCQGAVALSNAIVTDNNTGVSYANILSYIQGNVTNAISTNNNIATAIATAIGAGSDAGLISKLELDFDSAFAINSYYSPQNIQSVIAGISITNPDGPSIAANFYYPLSGSNSLLSASQGAVALTDAISLNNAITSAPYITISNSIATHVAALSGASLTNRQIAISIANAVGAEGNIAFINALELDFAQSRTATQVQSSIASFLPIITLDAAEIVANIYDNIASSPNIYLSSLQGVVALTNDIDADYKGGAPYATILGNIQSGVEALSDSFTNNDIANAIAIAIGAGNDAELINRLELDFDIAYNQKNKSPQNIQSAIAAISITNPDGSSIAVSLYNNIIPANNDAFLSLLQGAVALSNDIIAYNAGGTGPSYYQILANIQNAVAVLPNGFTNNDIATAIAIAIGAGNDTGLISKLELDFDSAGTSPQTIQSAIVNVYVFDAPSITTSIYRFNNEPQTFLSSIQSVLTLSNDITIDNINHVVSYITINNNIATGVAALSGANLTKNGIATAIANGVGASGDTALINALELDLDQESGISAATIQANIASSLPIIVVDGPSIAASLYANVGHLSSLQGAVALSNDITADYTNNAIPYATILGNIQSGVAALTGSFTSKNLANSIAIAIGASNDIALIDRLELDFNSVSKTPSGIQRAIAGISITNPDGPSIAASLYGNIASTSTFLSSLKGVIALSNDITADYNAGTGPSYSNILTSIKSAVAALTRDFTNNNIAIAIATAYWCWQ